jgi:hypothetical protein
MPDDAARSLLDLAERRADGEVGDEAWLADAEDKGQLAVTEPAIDVAVTEAGANLTLLDVETVTVSSIPMDVELLFSRSPLAQQAGLRVHQAGGVADGEAAGGQDEGDGVGARRAGEAEHARRGEHAG